VDRANAEVAVPEWLMVEIAEICPREDRTPERRVFSGFTADVAKNVMARACKAAGIVHRHPHDLRHRYASVQIGRGVPVTQVAAQLGHSRKGAVVVWSRCGLGRTARGVLPANRQCGASLRETQGPIDRRASLNPCGMGVAWRRHRLLARCQR